MFALWNRADEPPGVVFTLRKTYIMDTHAPPHPPHPRRSLVDRSVDS